MLIDYAGYEDPEHQVWVDAQVTAGVFALVNDVLYGAGSYLIYVDWQQNPGGAQPATPTPA